MLKTTIERLEGNTIKLTVTVPAEDVDAAIARSYERVGKKLRIPGFRKGKAPRPVVDNYVGKDHVRAEATEEIVDASYSEALDAEGLRPIDQPELDELDVVADGQDFTFSATIELRPELTLSGTEGFSAEVPPKTVSEAQIDEQIEVARDRFASLEPVEDRGVQEGDFALISFVGDVAGEPYDDNVVDKYMYELGKGQMPLEFDQGLLGMKPGDEKRIEFEIPDTSSNPEFVGKTAGFEVTVHEIKAKVLPEVDDEFAVSAGGYDTVEQMREDVRARLQAQQTLQHQRAAEEELKRQLAERLVGEAPEPMVRAKTQQLMRDFTSMLEKNHMTVESYCEAVSVPIETLEADLNRQGEQSVREDLALEALFRAKGMEVTEQDIKDEVASMAGSPEEGENMLQRWTENGLIPVLKDQIMHHRAVEWLLEHATITEVEPGAEAATPAEKPKAKTASKKAAPKAAKASKAATEAATDAADTTEE